MTYFKIVGIGGMAFALWLGSPLSLQAHVGDHPSVHDTVAGIASRMKDNLTEAEIKRLTAYEVEAMLALDERHVLSTQHITFKVDVPVVVTILRDRALNSEPFWLRERFQLTGLVFKENDREFDVWESAYPAGPIGLGVNSLTGGEAHYVILLRPQESGQKLQVSDLYPARLRVEPFADGVKPYVDQDTRIKQIPAALTGQTLIRTEYDSRNDAKLIDVFQFTRYPAQDEPDQVVLTWSEDPKTTQTLQWRTSTNVASAYVSYQKKSLWNRFQPSPLIKVAATTTPLETPHLLNDPLIHRHHVVLRDLSPGTTYVYSVGDGTRAGWSELAEFTTAPEGDVPFSFIYMGDAQNGLDRWGSLARNAFRERPDAAFYLMAGDLVDRGNERDDWDSFFHNAESIFDRRQLVPIIGNHECQGGNPALYLKQFDLPKNGPETITAERAYAFEYSNALFVVLDSNLSPKDQAPWLESVLKNSKATWKFVSYHHPAYSSAKNRDNSSVRKYWLPLFDKYHVDLALQGHDHAYLRTWPMKGDRQVSSPKEGTIYIVSVSGTKMYSQAQHEYTEFGMTNTPTYQVLDIQISGDRLVYRAYDIDGNPRDDFVIEK